MKTIKRMMKYKVVSVLSIQDNTAVMIEGSGANFRNNIMVNTEKGKQYKVLSVGMTDYKEAKDIGSATSLLLEGRFVGEYIEMNILSYKGYTGTVEFSDEDNLFYGSILNVPDIVLYQGETEELLFEDFKNAVLDYVEFRK